MLKNRIKDIIQITLGVILVIIGLIGGFIPIFQGWMFGIPGIIILAKYFPSMKRLLFWLSKRFKICNVERQRTILTLFLLNKDVTYLNHGSFGACPKPIFESLINRQTQLENQPVQFLDQDSQELMLNSRNSLAKFIDCDPEGLVFFQNPTTAINEVVRSLSLNRGDEVLSTDHEYGAMDKTWNFICNKTGSKHIKATIQIPMKDAQTFTDNFLSGVTKNTKIFFLSHMTSATGLYFPMEEICKFAKDNNILTIIDGAHIPGHFPLSINKLQPDIYVGACHKWLLCPKGVSFLYVRKEYQKNIDPLIISWGYDSEYPSNYSEFQAHHYWQGTRDISAFLTIPDAIQFRKDYNWDIVSQNVKKIFLKHVMKFIILYLGILW